LLSLTEANQMQREDIASAIFTVTPDLCAAFPARAARQLGWEGVALLDAQEIPVPHALPLCIRVLVHWNTQKAQTEVHHVYLRRAVVLRPDLGQVGPGKQAVTRPVSEGSDSRNAHSRARRAMWSSS
jgi:chorismate mutase